jgi:hypothetical protein
MSCANLTEDGRACGDEGQYCDGCFIKAMQEMSYLQHISKYAAGAPIDAEFEQEMREAGRK